MLVVLSYVHKRLIRHLQHLKKYHFLNALKPEILGKQQQNTTINLTKYTHWANKFLSMFINKYIMNLIKNF